MWNDRVRQQQAITGQHLALTHDHTTGAESEDRRGIVRGTTAIYHHVYCGGRRHCPSAFATAAAATGGAELPKFERKKENNAAASAGFLQPNCSICVEYRPTGMEAGLCPLSTHSANSAGSPRTTGDPAKL